MIFATSSWLLRLLGFDTESVPDDADMRVMLTNLPQSWQVFVLIAAVAGLLFVVGFLYRREIDTCSRRVKTFLAVMRIAVLLVLLAVFLGPAVTFTQQRRIPGQIVVLRDASQSMSTRDRYLNDAAADAVAALRKQSRDAVRSDQPSRAAVVDDIFSAEQRRLITELRQRGRVIVADFSSNMKRHDHSASPEKTATSDNKSPDTPVAGNSEFPSLTQTAIGQTTNLHRAILEALEEKQLAAIVVFTDGQHTGQDDPALAARRAKELGVPLFFVGIGDPTSRKNLEISEIYADRQVWINSTFEIQALLRAEGYAGDDAVVELLERKRAANNGPQPAEAVIETKTVRIPDGGGQIRVSFSRTIDIPGKRQYAVRVKSKPDEISQDDNRSAEPLEVTILQNQARVLMIAGAYTWDYRGVQRVLQEEESVNLSCWVQTIAPSRAQDGNTIITRLPDTEEELLKYDVVLLFDPDPKDFDEKFVKLLQKFVDEKARGLLYMVGPKFSGRFLSEQPTRQLADLLPVSFGDIDAIAVATLITTNTRAWPLGAVASNVDQPIMRFYPDPRESMQLWKSLPGIYWSFPTKTAKPGARVLLEHTDPTLRQIEGSRPLLVTRRFGGGRTVYFGFSSSWRWKSVGEDSEFFLRFWMQTIRYLIEGRLLEGKRRGYLAPEKSRYERGDTVVITAELNDATSKPITAPQIIAILRTGEEAEQPLTLSPVANQPGFYQATLAARKIGRHELTVKLPDDPSAEPTMSTVFFVAEPSAEKRDLRLNAAKLQELAALSGGKYVTPNEALKLAASVPDKTRTLRVDGKPKPLWDTPLLIGLLVVLLSIEWATRKYFKLL